MKSTSEKTAYRAWKGWNQSSFGTYDKATAAYFAAETLMCGFANLKGIKVLEIGFGNGAFARWAVDQEATYVGTEIIPELLDCAREAGLTVIDGTTPSPLAVLQQAVDLVVAFDVFEHFDVGTLREQLVQIKGCLRRGGCLFMRVPSGDSPFALAIQNGDLTHRTFLGSSALQQLADHAGLTLLAIREPSFLFRGIGLRAIIRRIAITALRRAIFPVITHGFMGGGHPVLTPNLVAVLRND
jgi:2-polyprenyl-3-methyl-5-hydroxy-6-metoxy-1,4-benzoquinol methylase